MKTKTREKIKQAVLNYTQNFKGEYGLFKKQNTFKNFHLTDKLGTVKGSDIIERTLFEIPENLFIILKGQLDNDEWAEHTSKEGSFWFATTFPVFKLGDRHYKF